MLSVDDTDINRKQVIPHGSLWRNPKNVEFMNGTENDVTGTVFKKYLTLIKIIFDAGEITLKMISFSKIFCISSQE